MASPLTHSRLKLWIWIVLIAAGSIIVLLSLFAGWWWYARRNRARRKALPSPVLAPTRKVTIRRGRMVSSSRYLSLTGSKFGLGQFMGMEEKEQLEKGRNRSKSPFMWWMSNNQDRSQSRQSQMSSQPQMDEVQTPYFQQKPEPAFYNQHTHKESTTSDYSLASIINARELADDARVDPPHADDRLSGSPQYINFSRAFSPLQQSILTSGSAPKVLSQIVESSPRHSDVSKHPSIIGTREMAAVVDEDGEHMSTPTTIPHPRLASAPALAHHQRPLQTFRSVPDHLLQRSSGQNENENENQTMLVSRFSFTTETSLSLSTLDTVSRTHSVPNFNKAIITSHHPASPRYGPLPLPRRDRDLERTYLDHTSPPPSQHGTGTGLDGSSSRSGSEKQPSSETVHEIPSSFSYAHNDTQQSDSNSTPFWSSRPDLQPVPGPVPMALVAVARKPSKKRNVLRKKSIRRAEIVSWVGN